VQSEHQTEHVHLLFNNAGIGGGGSFIANERSEWERTFDICWKGVYHSTRVFLPLLLASPAGHLVNVSSVNGFWASLGAGSPHTAYSAAKFAVKGFSEALINDLRINAPHVSVSVVMPGHVGTQILRNTARAFGRAPDQLSDAQLEEMRERAARSGLQVEGLSTAQFRKAMAQRFEAFSQGAPLSAADAARTILQGVREKRWRILVGEDAHVMDRLVREAPEDAYEPEFMTRLRKEAAWQLG